MKNKTRSISCYMAMLFLFVPLQSCATHIQGRNSPNEKKIPLSSQQTNRQADLNRLLNRLASPPAGPYDCRTAWKAYLEETFAFNNQILQETIKDLHARYLSEEAALNQQVRKVNAYKKKMNTAWCRDLINRFGKAYVKKNLKAVNTAMVAVSLAKDRALLEKAMKNTLYAQSLSASAIEEYFGLFIDFSDRTESCRTPSLLDTYKAVQDYLSVHNRTATNRLATVGTLQTDAMIADQTKNNQALFSFFNTHKDLNPAYSPQKAFDALKKALE